MAAQGAEGERRAGPRLRHSWGGEESNSGQDQEWREHRRHLCISKQTSTQRQCVPDTPRDPGGLDGALRETEPGSQPLETPYNLRYTCEDFTKETSTYSVSVPVKTPFLPQKITVLIAGTEVQEEVEMRERRAESDKKF